MEQLSLLTQERMRLRFPETQEGFGEHLLRISLGLRST